ncbi:MAG TPA: hypothetical protein VLL49_08390 [Anaerolineales bacterium]|nr:hypothetical protein [Anaerolineales bacterium]
MSHLLARLQKLPREIRLGVIGVGNIGKGIVLQAQVTPGIDCVAIADIRIDRAIGWASALGREYLVVDSQAAMHDAIRSGKLAVCTDGLLIAACDFVDVQVDATYSVIGGLSFALDAIAHHKHVIMMNSEADVIFGPHLLARARREGVVYTSADGDQHTVIKRLINEVELWGFRTVLAGNMKGYLDRYSSPTSIVPEADRRFMDYKMCTSYTDGTKLCIEMALIANAIGARTLVPGMLGPAVTDVYEVFQRFDFAAIWDGTTPLVDYVLGAHPPGGVFVVGFNDHPHQMETLGWYPCRLGSGPFYVFHRPYHLGHIETMACIAEAFLDGSAALQPDRGMLTNVYAYAKNDLQPGDVLDGIGGYRAYGLIENVSANRALPGLPICLSEGIALRHALRKDAKIHIDDILLPPQDPGWKAYDEALRAGSGIIEGPRKPISPPPAT